MRASQRGRDEGTGRRRWPPSWGGPLARGGPPFWRHALIGVAVAACGAALAQPTHRVAPGDTLSSLARRFDTTVAELRSRNELRGDLLRVGQVLELPGPAGFRTVRAGADEDWEALAARWGRTVATLRAANPGLEDPAGRELLLPPGDGDTVRALPGDEPLTLAARHGVAPGTLITLNGWSPPYRLEAGDPVLLPPDALAFGAGGAASRQGDAGGAPVGGAPASAPSGGGGSEDPPAIGPVRPPPREDADAGPEPAARETHRRAQERALERFGELAGRLDPPEEGFAWPLAGRLSSSFGWRNVSVNGNRYHQGIDLAAPPGTPVLAAQSGTVVRAGWIGAYGYAVYVDHDGGVQTRYAHLSRIAARVGQRVDRGDTVGAVGSSGASTGPHLHFEVRLSGHAVDPLGHLPPRLAGAAPR